MHGLNGWDYAVIAFYILLTVASGLMCRRLNRNPSDYFRGGGNMLWWIGGVSALTTAISTWSFTGGAAKCYNEGFLYPLVQMLMLVGTLALMWFVAPLVRRLRVITAMEAVYRRFGIGTEQFYTWFALPMGLFWGGIALNTLGVFMSGVFQVSLVWTIVGSGMLVTFLAVVGGQWALSFLSVIQAVILFFVAIMVACFSVNHPLIGGITKLTSVLPVRHLHFAAETSSSLIWLWIVWQVFTLVLMQLDVRMSVKYVRVKDDGGARRMVLMHLLPQMLLLLPVIMHLPSMCAAVLYPDLKSIFPQLKNPEEGAWLAMAVTVLPQGLLGLMVCALFGASAQSLDMALNSNAGFFVRNVYKRCINPAASDKRQVLAGKVATGCLGISAIAIGLLVNALRSLNLFDLLQILNALLLIPMVVPVALGLFIKRTPNWSGWSTVLVGMAVAIAANACYSPVFAQRLLGSARALNPREITDSQFILVSIVSFAASSLWFVSTGFFWRKAAPENRERIETLIADMARPVDHIAEGGENQDTVQYLIVGQLSVAAGGFLLLCAAIPNPLRGRLCFLLIGSILFAMGLSCFKAYRKTANSLKFHESHRSTANLQP